MAEVTLVNIKGKTTIMSPYKLGESELQRIMELVPSIKSSEVVNIVDENIYAGIIIKVGTKMIDLTLNSALLNLKKQIYESN